jgi:hypothetical protein
MAEVKNAFIQSKMNKDLDDRLLPSGEYRNARKIYTIRRPSQIILYMNIE